MTVAHITCSSGQFLLAGRCGRNVMSLEGKCCWEKDSSACPRGFDVQNSCEYVLFARNLPLPSPTKGVNFAYDHTQTGQ